jgi:hypothetical protein
VRKGTKYEESICGILENCKIDFVQIVRGVTECIILLVGGKIIGVARVVIEIIRGKISGFFCE